MQSHRGRPRVHGQEYFEKAGRIDRDWFAAVDAAESKCDDLALDEPIYGGGALGFAFWFGRGFVCDFCIQEFDGGVTGLSFELSSELSLAPFQSSLA